MNSLKKEFKKTGEQLKILHERGLNVFPTYKSYEILKRTNYYNLINGYKDPFLKYGETDKYKNNSSFMEIYALYNFDRNIRSLFLKEILKFEDMVKSVVASDFSSKYGYEEDKYLDIANFTQFSDNSEALKLNNLILKLMNLIRIDDYVQPYIKHYRDEHNYVPLWVLVNSMTFGDISKFYSYMTTRDKIDVSKQLSKNTTILYSQLDSYLQMIGVYRNILAHDERFYEYQKKNISGKPYKIQFKSYLNLGNINSSVFALIISLRILLDKKDFEEFFKNFIGEIKLLERNLNTISVHSILKRMNFIIPSRNLNNLENIIVLLSY